MVAPDNAEAVKGYSKIKYVVIQITIGPCDEFPSCPRYACTMISG